MTLSMITTSQPASHGRNSGGARSPSAAPRPNGLTLTTDAGFTTGSRPEAPGYADPAPMMREAGRTGL